MVSANVAIADHPTEFSAKLFGVIDRMDIDGYVSMLADDVRVRLADAPVLRGKKAVRDTLTQLAWTLAGVRHRVRNEWEIGDRVIHQLMVTFTRIDGSRVSMQAVTICRLSGDLISEYDFYIDPGRLFE